MGDVIQLRPAPERTPQLAMLRRCAGLTQRELADELGVPAAAVRAYEHGKERIRRRHCEQLAELFGVSVESLMGAPL